MLGDGRAAAFCYPVLQTERHWDVSVDTLEGYRGRGLAGLRGAGDDPLHADAGKGAGVGRAREQRRVTRGGAAAGIRRGGAAAGVRLALIYFAPMRVFQAS